MHRSVRRMHSRSRQLLQRAVHSSNSSWNRWVLHMRYVADGCHEAPVFLCVSQELQEALGAAQEDAAAAQESAEEEQRAHLEFVMRIREHHRLEKVALRKRCRHLVGQYKVGSVGLVAVVAVTLCLGAGDAGESEVGQGKGPVCEFAGAV